VVATAAMTRPAVSTEESFEHAHVFPPESWHPAQASPVAMNSRGACGACGQWNP